MILLAITDLTLPLANPIHKFLVILLIILFAPILLNRFKIPHLLGLIIAGVLIGPNGFNLILRDSGIVMSGTAGLLYIMFLAGLEIDLAQFKKNSFRSFIFGMYTFIIPMALGTTVGYYVLQFSLPTSILLASMFASHTLIAYPIISKMGLAKNKAVNIAVGGTMITDTLALIVLAVVVGMAHGQVDQEFWIRLSISIMAFGLTVIIFFPIIARWFFKKFDDPVAQYIFVLTMVFMGAVLAEVAGIEGIIGAFLAGLSLNRLIPHTSPLMNRIEFVGNAIFIPFFLIGVGMLVDYRAFFQSFETITVAAVMTLVATGAKFSASWLAQKSFRLSSDERKLIFGLSNAQAAATLAAVLVGYNVIIGETPDGEPIRLLGESILNGTIIMILVTCTIASFAAQRGAHNIVNKEKEQPGRDDEEPVSTERILIPINYRETVPELISLSVILKSKRNRQGVYALHVISEQSEADHPPEKYAEKILEEAAKAASATDNYVNKLLRYDMSASNGIAGVVKEHKITDIVMGLTREKGASASFLGNLTDGILNKCAASTYVYKGVQPLGTIKRHIVIIPANAEKEPGFPFWVMKAWNIARNTGTRLVFYATEPTLNVLRNVKKKVQVEAEFHLFEDWDDFLIISREVRPDDNLIIVLSRKNKPSYRSNMANIPIYLNKYFKDNSFILIYPVQAGMELSEGIDYKSGSLAEPIEKIDDLAKTIARLLRMK
jgi:Kef-type K+ transport system membrane component KefB/nucleotide-binding universal stress UspA family protein